ncbi:LysR family transcriptional regulator [Clostridium paridis]|uniref:LysR family transcriptional regulator n=1 Tax=Clostridium paridis TaxID=2803863 RepID=A0A937FJJ7_9CLOT|nr:LysR family transcriptional regulator [Clostridium paridis]MBL4933498.1 LysR family transcriptional regulator [Clostridium paridis]
MEINDLKIFKIVAYEKSISKAALKMGYVQSNVTLRIKALEKELETDLLIRHNKGISLTDDGKRLLEYAEQIIRLIDEAKSEFKGICSNNYLKIGATQVMAASIAPKWLKKYSEGYPDVILSLKTDNQINLVEQIIRGELDGAFTNVKPKHESMSEAFTFVEDIAIISSVEIKATEELLEKPIIINSNNDCPYRSILEKWVYINKGIQRIIEVDSLEAIIKFVEDDMGISLLPKNLIKGNDKIKIHELANEFNKVAIYFIKRKDLRRDHPVNDFIKMLFKEDLDRSKRLKEEE